MNKAREAGIKTTNRRHQRRAGYYLLSGVKTPVEEFSGGERLDLGSLGVCDHSRLQAVDCCTRDFPEEGDQAHRSADLVAEKPIDQLGLRLKVDSPVGVLSVP